jgi:hypothetical protein
MVATTQRRKPELSHRWLLYQMQTVLPIQQKSHCSQLSFHPTKNTLTIELNMLLAGPRVSNPFNISNCSHIFTKISKKILISVRDNGVQGGAVG